VSATFAIDERHLCRTPNRGTDPSRSCDPKADAVSCPGPRTAVSGVKSTTDPAASRLLSAAAGRQHEQLPAFTPLFEEVELDGWSSDPQSLGGNFHDWTLLNGSRVLVMVGQATGVEPWDPMEAALIAQSAWTAARAHARHTNDAGCLLTLVAQTLWTNPTMYQQVSLAVAIIDVVGGSASLASAGECLGWRVRAATCEQLSLDEPALGAGAKHAYRAHNFSLSLRERLLLLADHSAYRPSKIVDSIVVGFTQLAAESHRRMTASDALAIVRQRYECEIQDSQFASASVVAVRRR
jgi:Stage II sporulation protein E (SpoIIE)